MNRETVIALAREAGLKVATNIGGVTLVGSPLEGVPAIAHITIEEMERFAALVAAHEREECAKAIDDSANICAPGSIQTVLREQARCIRSRT